MVPTVALIVLRVCVAWANRFGKGATVADWAARFLPGFLGQKQAVGCQSPGSKPPPPPSLELTLPLEFGPLYSNVFCWARKV